MEDKQAKQANLKRRGFLLTLGAGSAGAAAVVAGAGGTAVQAVQQAVAEPEKGQGYALSEHVRNYYRTTRV